MRVKYYGQFNPPVDAILHKYVDFSGGFFIECGAFDGIDDSNCKFLEESMGWNGINIEASPTLFEKLKVNRPKSINLNYALSDYNGVTKFTKCQRNGVEIGLGAIDGNVIDDKEKANEIVINCINWDTLLINHDIRKVDLLSLDIEGHEIIVLKDIMKHKIKPKILCVEHGHVGRESLDNLLLNKYNLLEVYQNNSIYGRG